MTTSGNSSLPYAPSTLLPSPTSTLVLLTLQQLRYICAVADTDSFAAAARVCGVTQPTLSAMVAKLERELGAQVFDRRRKPVATTALGAQVIARARRVLAEAASIPNLVDEAKQRVSGPLHVGLLPTIAPYLLPMFIRDFTAAHPDIDLTLSEHKTADIADRLREGTLDLGLIATPHEGLHELRTEPLFEEAFFAFAKTPPDKAYLLPADIDPDELWVLEEGHCFGDQVLNLCELSRHSHSLTYASGSIDTLKRLVLAQGGVTVLPELAVRTLPASETAHVRPFAAPAPLHTVSLAMREDYVRGRVAQVLAKAVREAVSD